MSIKIICLITRRTQNHRLQCFKICISGINKGVIPEYYVKEINNLTFNFIWEGKPAKIKKKNIISDIKHDRLKMLHFEIMDKALKIAWIKRLTVHGDAPWKIIPEFATTEYGGLSFPIECQYDVKHLS